ncbi:MAG: hypothetical protein WCG87_04595 [Bacteroidota bacterium]
MQTITIEIKNTTALKAIQALEHQHAINIIDTTDFDSPSLPGETLSISSFKKWIADAENAPTVSLSQAKAKWASNSKKIQKITK